MASPISERGAVMPNISDQAKALIKEIKTKTKAISGRTVEEVQKKDFDKVSAKVFKIGQENKRTAWDKNRFNVFFDVYGEYIKYRAAYVTGGGQIDKKTTKITEQFDKIFYKPDVKSVLAEIKVNYPNVHVSDSKEIDDVFRILNSAKCKIGDSVVWISKSKDGKDVVRILKKDRRKYDPKFVNPDSSLKVKTVKLDKNLKKNIEKHFKPLGFYEESKKRVERRVRKNEFEQSEEVVETKGNRGLQSSDYILSRQDYILSRQADKQANRSNEMVQDFIDNSPKIVDKKLIEQLKLREVLYDLLTELSKLIKQLKYSPREKVPGRDLAVIMKDMLRESKNKGDLNLEIKSNEDLIGLLIIDKMKSGLKEEYKNNEVVINKMTNNRQAMIGLLQGLQK